MAYIAPPLRKILTPQHKILCSACEKDLSPHVQLFDPQSVLHYCVPCFCNLPQFPAEYQVFSKLNFSVFEAHWTAQEELQLFEGLKRFGFGSWAQIAEFMQSKEAEEVERHYRVLFLSGEGDIPERLFAAGRGDRVIEEKMQEEVHEKKKEERPAKVKTGLTVGNAAELVGFMPLRGDFEVEYDNEAELLLAELDFLEEDTEQERAMKLRLLETYNCRIDEREKRRRVVQDLGLLDFRRQSQFDRRLTREERELIQLLKPFAQFNSGQDHLKLIESLLREKRLAYFISSLKAFRAAGYSSFAQVEAYVLEQMGRSQGKKKAKGWHLTSEEKALRTRLDPAKLEPFAQVTVAEFSFCEEMQLPVSQYLGARQHLQREMVSGGRVRKELMEEVPRLDRRKADSVYQFLKSYKRVVGD